MKNLQNEKCYDVVKSNDLIRKSRFDLSLTEQRIILRLIQVIKPDTYEFETYRFDIKEFCEICNISSRSGSIYNNIKSALLSLKSKCFWVQIDKDTETVCSWISKATLRKSTSIVEIELDRDLKPYLLELNKNFTQYSMFYTLGMKSKYSIRLYEFLKSYQYTGVVTCEIEQIMSQLSVPYTRWIDLKRFVIDIAVSEINQLTDIEVSYKSEKESRSIKRIVFMIKDKDIIECVNLLRNGKTNKK